MGQIATSGHSASELPSVATVSDLAFASTCGRVSSYCASKTNPGSLVPLRQLREVEATSRTGKGIGRQLRLTLGAKEIKGLAADGTLGGIVGNGRVTDGTQLLPAVGTGTGVRGQVGAAGRALAAQVNPSGRTHLGVRRHGRVAMGADQIKG
jgi:hypothetical protein